MRGMGVNHIPIMRDVIYERPLEAVVLRQGAIKKPLGCRQIVS